jgi:hypothetical protein
MRLYGQKKLSRKTPPDPLIFNAWSPENPLEVPACESCWNDISRVLEIKNHVNNDRLPQCGSLSTIFSVFRKKI